MNKEEIKFVWGQRVDGTCYIELMKVRDPDPSVFLDVCDISEEKYKEVAAFYGGKEVDDE